MKKSSSTLLSFISATADKMAIWSLSEVSFLGWYQPEIDNNIIRQITKKETSTKKTKQSC